MPRRRFAAPATALAALAACGGGGGGDAAARAEFTAAAARLYASDNPFFGRSRAAELQAARRELPPTAAAAAIDLDLKLFADHLRFGRTAPAVAAIDDALQRVAAAPELQAVRPDLQFWHGLGWLRAAEQQNCIARHQPACCIWPLQGSGLHRDAEAARAALDAFLLHLQAEPDALGVRWLAHVAATACGATARIPPVLRWPSPPAPAAAAAVPRFHDRAAELGVASLDLSGGACVLDCNGDGWLDLAGSTSTPDGPMHLYVRQPDGRFADETVARGLGDQLGGLNLMAVDHDGDGDQDLLVLRGAWLHDLGQIRNSLLENDGRGHFRDVTHRAGLAAPARPTQTAAFGDFDGDGDLDLYVGNESRREQLAGMPPGGDFPNQLFRNNGDGTYTDVAAAAGVTNDRYCKGVCAGDYDDDGDLDLYVSNVGRNRLYRNDGGLRFTDVAPMLRVTEPAGRSFACWFFDHDHDGRLDLFVAGFDATLDQVAADLLRQAGGHAPPGGVAMRLYHNVGGRFEDWSARLGVDRVTLPMGAGFADVDADGWLDIYLGTGDPGYQTLIPNLLLRSDGGARFVDCGEAAGLSHLQKGHGVAFADLDHDGDVDLWHQLGGFYPGDGFYNALFENGAAGGPARLLVLELQGRGGNRAAIGARLDVELLTPHGPRRLHRAIGAVSSYAGSTWRQELGLGDATAVARVAVRWPDGSRQEFRDLPRGGHLRLVQGEAAPQPLDRPPLPLRAAAAR